MNFGNMGFWEVLIIFVVVLLLFGAKRIPEIAGSMGKGIREFKKSLTDVDRAIREPERSDSRVDGPEKDAERLTGTPAEQAVRADAKDKEPKRLIG
ncbi:MAG: Sec-independent protein translocase subunit TatA/TatB [Gemmatimonadaceae bacterium]